VLGLDDTLVCADWLHDIGYAPALVATGFHPLDGARFLESVGLRVGWLVWWRITRSLPWRPSCAVCRRAGRVGMHDTGVLVDLAEEVSVRAPRCVIRAGAAITAPVQAWNSQFVIVGRVTSSDAPMVTASGT